MAFDLTSGKKSKRLPNATEVRAMQLAARLVEALREKKRLSRYAKAGTWSHEFLKLLEDHSDEEVTEVFEWYLPRIGDDYIPAAYSAKAFRQKFGSLIDARRRDMSDREQDMDLLRTLPHFEELHGRALELIEDRIRPLVWPSGTGAQLEEVVTVSLARARVLFDKLARYIAPYENQNDGDKPATVRVVEEFLADYNNEDSFITAWFSGIPARLRKWKNFSGDISIFTFAEDHDDFKRRGYAIAERFCGDGNLWQFTMKKINA